MDGTERLDVHCEISGGLIDRLHDKIHVMADPQQKMSRETGRGPGFEKIKGQIDGRNIICLFAFDNGPPNGW